MKLKGLDIGFIDFEIVKKKSTNHTTVRLPALVVDEVLDAIDKSGKKISKGEFFGELVLDRMEEEQKKYLANHKE